MIKSIISSKKLGIGGSNEITKFSFCLLDEGTDGDKTFFFKRLDEDADDDITFFFQKIGQRYR